MYGLTLAPLDLVARLQTKHPLPLDDTSEWHSSLHQGGTVREGTLGIKTLQFSSLRFAAARTSCIASRVVCLEAVEGMDEADVRVGNASGARRNSVIGRRSYSSQAGLSLGRYGYPRVERTRAATGPTPPARPDTSLP